MRAGEVIRVARKRAGLTQADLAKAAGVSQPKLSVYERGAVQPRPETLDRVLRATRARPSVVLEQRADDVLAAAFRRHITNVRVFGSSVHGTDTQESDIDLLVTFDNDASLFDLSGFVIDAEALLGYPVDVVSDSAPMTPILARIFAEAVAL